MKHLTKQEHAARETAYRTCPVRPTIGDFDAQLGSLLGVLADTARKWRIARGLPARVNPNAPYFQTAMGPLPGSAQRHKADLRRRRERAAGGPDGRAMMSYAAARLAIELLMTSGADEATIDALLARLRGLL